MRFFEFALPFTSSFKLEVPNGRVGPEVADIQKILMAMGYPLPQHGVDGVRGPETSEAVKQFQQDAGIAVDGDPGPETIKAMNSLISDKPEIVKGLTKSTDADVKGSYAGGSGKDIDVSAIQDPDFNKKLDKIASALGVSSRAIMAVIKHESGGNPKAVNRYSGAVGLIQFMPKTAASLGTSTQELLNMSAVEQLDYVYKYYKMVGVRSGMDAGDLYVATFMPAALGKGDNHVLGQKGAGGFSGAVYAQNAPMDRDGDGAITVGDIKNSVARFA